MADLTNSTPQAPATVPAPAAPVAPDATPAAPSLGASITVEAFAAKLAERAAAAAPAASELPAVVTPGTPAAPEVVATPAAPQAAEPAKFEGFVSELRKIEGERDTAHATIRELKVQAEKAAQLEAALAVDPIKFLLDRGVTNESLQDFLLNGAKKPDPAATLAAETAAKVAKFEAAEAEREAAKNVAAFKATSVVPHLSETTHPLLHAMHGADTAEVVYNLMNHEFQQGNNVSAEQAAAKLEGGLAGLVEKLMKAKPAAAPVVAAPAAKPVAKAPAVLTNTPAGSDAEPYEVPSMEARIERATAVLKQRLAARA